MKLDRLLDRKVKKQLKSIVLEKCRDVGINEAVMLDVVHASGCGLECDLGDTFSDLVGTRGIDCHKLISESVVLDNGVGHSREEIRAMVT
jgi:hypothetical protein